MKIETTPRTWKQVKGHPAVHSACVEGGGEELMRWIHLKAGYSAQSDPHSVHSGNGRTVREAIDDVFPVVECQCDDCTASRYGKDATQ